MEQPYHYTQIAEAIRFLTAHYKEQPTLEAVADHVNMSKFHFQRLFQHWAGVSPKQFLQCITLEHAKQSLQAGRSTLDTAYEVGLSGNGRLHDLFVKMEACTPGEFRKKRAGIEIVYNTIQTPFGSALIAETDKGICKLSFLEENEFPLEELAVDFPEANVSEDLGENGKKVKQYFLTWEVPKQKIMLDLKGTPFQIQVWKALLSIPSSRLLAYGDIANMIDKPNASRAVGTAIGKNPIAYLIPCHRVIRESGHIGGYRWGHERKIAINGYESVRMA